VKAILLLISKNWKIEKIRKQTLALEVIAQRSFNVLVLSTDALLFQSYGCYWFINCKTNCKDIFVIKNADMKENSLT